MAYIVLNRLVGQRLPGLPAPAVALGVAVYAPVLAVVLLLGRFTDAALGYALVAVVLSSVVPYAADLMRCGGCRNISSACS